VRRDSTLSDSNEDVFDEDHPSSPPVKSAPQKSPSSTSPSQNQAKKADEPPAKLVPAPPPKENIWEKRKTVTPAAGPADAAPTSEPAKEPEPEPAPPKAEPKQEAAPPQKSTAAGPTGNVWERRKQEMAPAGEEEGGFGGSHWGNKRPEGGQAPYGRGSGDRGRGRGVAPRGGGRGRGADRPSGDRKKDKPLPKSVDEMPKMETSKGKDWSNSNKFAGLIEDDDDDNNEAPEPAENES